MRLFTPPPFLTEGIVHEVVSRVEPMPLNMQDVYSYLNFGCEPPGFDKEIELQIIVESVIEDLESALKHMIWKASVRMYASQYARLVKLPYGPWQSIDSAQNGEYVLDLDSDYKLRNANRYMEFNCIGYDLAITGVAGYDSDKIPAKLKLAILEESRYRYDEGKVNIQPATLAGLSKYNANIWL